MRAGLSTCDVITQCLSEGAAATVVRVALTVSLIVTYPLVLYPATEIVERALLVEVGGGRIVLGTCLSSNAGAQGTPGVELRRRGLRTLQVRAHSRGGGGVGDRLAQVAATVLLGYALPSFGVLADLVGSFMVVIIGHVLARARARVVPPVRSMPWAACAQPHHPARGVPAVARRRHLAVGAVWRLRLGDVWRRRNGPRNRAGGAGNVQHLISCWC